MKIGGAASEVNDHPRRFLMQWTNGTGFIHNVPRQFDEEISGLVNENGEKLLYRGKSHSHAELFRYQDDLCEVTVNATRYGNYHGPLLDNDGELLTSTWTVNFRSKVIASKANVIVSDEMSKRIKSNIESALLSRPLWPSNYGRPDLPAASVGFVSID
jgi:hypothetical protein